MKKRLLFGTLAALLGFLLTPTLGRADESQLSPHRLDVLDRRGYFTPSFKTAVHALVDAKKEIVDANVEGKKLDAEVPDLEKQVADADAKAADLRKQFADLDRIDETDFTDLQNKLADPKATLEEQRIMAQAYVWAYPTSPHQADAQHDLQDIQKKIADQAQAAADAEAARIAAHAKLVERAKAHDLSVAEWRDLLQNMSKEELLKFLGIPQLANQDEWRYAGGYTTDSVTQQKVGLDINFNGGRVINVSELSH